MRYNRRMKLLRVCATFGILALSACSGQRDVMQPVQTAAAVGGEGRSLQGRPLQSEGIEASGVAAAAHLKMYVSNRSTNVVTVYADSASGDVKPLFRIRGANTR